MIGIYLIGTLLSTGLAVVLRRVIKRALAGWPSGRALSGHNVFRAMFRAFPYAFAFAPYMMVEHGFGIPVPASLVLCGSLLVSVYDLFTRVGLDGMHYFGGAAYMFSVVWAGCSLLILAQQSLSITTQRKDVTKS